MFKAAIRSTLHDDILAQLCEAIEQEQWPSGSRLPAELALAKQFGVSRNCIREVMKVLASRGVVEARPGSGTFLSENAKNLLRSARTQGYIFQNVNFKELMETRCLIEGQIAYYAVVRGTDEEFTELESLLYDTDDPEARREAHLRFHATMVRIAKHNLLERMWKTIQDEISVQRRESAELYTKWNRQATNNLVRNHSEILRCIRNRDAECARNAMIGHIATVWLEIFGFPLDM
jgi:GntR family transcriptional repressor for pyruvate dehydrogenase complex